MSIPVSAMHADVKDGYLSQAERQIESDPAWTHGTAVSYTHLTLPTIYSV